jgi:ribonuclease-3 family protein
VIYIFTACFYYCIILDGRDTGNAWYNTTGISQAWYPGMKGFCIMVNDIFGTIGGKFSGSHGNLNEYSPLVFAYVGDAVYELYVRTLLISKGNAPVNKLHKRSVSFVKAKAQSDIIHKMIESLAPEELDVVRRGRNAKSGTVPKNADITDYKYATGFESLLGYLYLKGDYTRLLELLEASVEKTEFDG